MYNAFFEFEQNPFSPKPDRAIFYRSQQHDTTLRSLSFAVQARMGLSSLTGEEGTGKTLLLDCLRETLESAQIHCAFLGDSRISTNRFFQTVASELDLRCPGTSPYQVFAALHRHTLEQAQKGRTVALIVDDAHNLPADVLNEILHLASLHDDKIKLLQTVLAGRPQLNSTLDALNLERLKQHAILSCHLEPFTAEETQNYIEYRFVHAGLRNQTIFPPDAMWEIHHRSRGFAPAIHAICEGLLLAAFSADSKVCTPEILDQVFHRTPTEPEGILEAGAVLAVTIDAAPSDPEPPALRTAMLRLVFDETPSWPPPLPVAASEPAETQHDRGLVFPGSKLTLPCRGLALGPKTPMRLSNGARAASVRPDLHPIFSGSALSKPALSETAGSAQIRAEGPLQRLLPINAAVFAPAPVVVAMAIDFPSSALQPAHSIGESLKSGMAKLTPKGLTRLVPLAWQPGRFVVPAAADDLRNIAQMPIDFPEPLLCHPTATTEGFVRTAGTPRVSDQFMPLPDRVTPRAAGAAAPSDADVSSISSTPQSMCPAYPAAKLLPAGTLRGPRVPVTPFRPVQEDPPSPRIGLGVQAHQVTLQNPAGSIVPDLTVSSEPTVLEHDHLVSLVFSIPPKAPRAEMPVQASLKLVQCLKPYGPIANIEPLNPRNSWLLLPSWKPAETRPNNLVRAAKAPSAEGRKPFFSRPKLVLAVATPILAGLALYASLPVVLPAAGALNQSWNRAHQAILERAAVELGEDFRSGLDDWMNRGGARPSWTSDAAGFVHPGALALYRPSLGLADYEMQFVGTIDKKALSWVVRATDFNNYYAVRLTVLKPGPVPEIGVIRYAVINGKTQHQVTTPLVMSARSDTVYRVSMEVHGDRFALSVQDRPVDSWSESNLRHGGIGFFSEQDAGSRIAALQVRGQDDMLGRLCAFLAPSEVASYQASRNELAALNVEAEMNAHGAGGGGAYASLPGYGSRLPRGGARLDPAFWQVPEVDVPNARRCGPPARVGGAARARHLSFPRVGASSSTVCN